MFSHISRFLTVASLSLLLLSTACTKSGSSDDGGDDRSPADDGGDDKGGSGFRTNCGTVVNGELQNPVSPADGFKVAVRIVASDLAIVNLPTGDALIKFHGIQASSSNSQKEAAKNILASIAPQGGYFIPAGPDCVSSVPGGQGALGQLFTPSGVSYNEKLLNANVVTTDSDPCGGNLLSSCYQALLDEAKTKNAGPISAFLWKPVSDSTGRLAVHSSPITGTVEVGGEIGTNQGGGNGFSSLARFQKPGCAYGAARVVIKDPRGVPYTHNGQPYIDIPNGCNRYCLQGGNIVQCVKN